MDKTNDIELRSDKVRNIVGKMPPAIERYGIFIIALVVMVLLFISFLVPYSQTIETMATFDNETHTNNGAAFIDSSFVDGIQIGMPISVEVNGETLIGEITAVSNQRINGRYTIEFQLPDNDLMYTNAGCPATIWIEKGNWFSVLFNTSH